MNFKNQLVTNYMLSNILVVKLGDKKGIESQQFSLLNFLVVGEI